MSEDGWIGVILAGGAGQRIGGNKPLVPLSGKPLIAHVIDRMSAQVGRIYLNGPADTLSIFGLPVLEDTRAYGPAAGVSAALAQAMALDAKGLLIVPCDMPFLPEDLVSTLAVGDICVPKLSNRPIWAVSAWQAPTFGAGHAAAQGTPDSARGPSLRSIFSALPTSEVAYRAQMASKFMSVNTREDLKHASEILEGH